MIAEFNCRGSLKMTLLEERKQTQNRNLSVQQGYFNNEFIRRLNWMQSGH